MVMMNDIDAGIRSYAMLRLGRPQSGTARISDQPKAVKPNHSTPLISYRTRST